MSIKRNSEIIEVKGREGSKIKNYFQPENTKNGIKFSLSHFTLEPRKKTFLHKLQSSEVYYILEGCGILKINDNSFEIQKDDSVYVPSMAEQKIENTGDEDLKFLCIVEPAWKEENEIVLE